VQAHDVPIAPEPFRFALDYQRAPSTDTNATVIDNAATLGENRTVSVPKERMDQGLSKAELTER
jgi:hypothetical protein